MIELTTAYSKINSLDKKIRIIQGGQGASKTYSVLQTIIIEAIYRLSDENAKNYKATVVTETYPMLQDGVIADTKAIMDSLDFNFTAFFNEQRKNLVIGKTTIQFRNVDNKDFHKAKGVRRNLLYINEANRVAWSSIEQLLTRTTDVVYIDYNPDREFWVHEKLMKREDADFLILTYKDNELLDDGERKEIELRRDNKEWWQVYGEGQLGTYSDRRIIDYNFIDKIPDNAKRMPSGMDFGQSPDQTILVNTWVRGAELYADVVFAENNLQAQTISGSERMSIADKLREVGFQKGWIIIADSADLVAINDLRNNGFLVYGVKKGTGSQKDGLVALKSYKLYITERSKALKDASEQWFWKEDHNGKIIPEPDGHEPDAIAALRYAVMGYKRA